MLACILFLSCASLAVGAGEKEKVFRAAVGDDGVQRVEVMGGSYFFNPNHIIVKVNVPVELIVRKESGIVPHNIVIKAPEAGVGFDGAMTIDPTVIRFT